MAPVSPVAIMTGQLLRPQSRPENLVPNIGRPLCDSASVASSLHNVPVFREPYGRYRRRSNFWACLVPDSAIANCGSGSGCRSYAERRRRFLEMDGDHFGTILLVNRAFEHMRCLVRSSV